MDDQELHLLEFPLRRQDARHCRDPHELALLLICERREMCCSGEDASELSAYLELERREKIVVCFEAQVLTDHKDIGSATTVVGNEFSEVHKVQNYLLFLYYINYTVLGGDFVY